MKNDTTSAKTMFRSDAIQRIMAFSALIVLAVGFSLASPYFRTFDNFVGILLATAVNGVLALGVTFVIITGGIDLSVGTVHDVFCRDDRCFHHQMAFADSDWHTRRYPGWQHCRAGQRSYDLAHENPALYCHPGYVVCHQRSFAGNFRVKPIYFNDTPAFREMAMGSIFGKIIPGFEVPNAVLILFGAAIIASLILSRTILGRYTYALGSNEEATRLSGVNVASWKTAVYTLCGFFAGLAGVLMSARLNSAQPALGAGYELDAIAAVVIGGTSLSGGEGTILGTVIGAFIISTLTNGLRILSVPQEWQMVVTGGIVVLAVYLDILRRRRK